MGPGGGWSCWMAAMGSTTPHRAVSPAYGVLALQTDARRRLGGHREAPHPNHSVSASRSTQDSRRRPPVGG